MKKTLAFVLLFSVGLWSCENPAPESSLTNSRTAALLQEPLFTVVSAPVLTAEQGALLSRIRNRPTSAEVHVATIRSAPAALLQSGNAVEFNLSPTTRFIALGEHVSQRGLNNLSWSGPLQDAIGWTQLVLTPKGVTGTVRTARTLHRIEPIGGGFHAISRIDVPNLPPEHPPGNTTGTLKTEPGRYEGSPSSGTRSSILALTAGNTQIDVLVAYTAAAAAAVGDIAAVAQLAVDETNTSYANSGVNIDLVKVYSAQLVYDESGRSYDQHVTALQSTSDGIMDNVHSLRDQYLADVVVLLVSDTEACGYAYAILAAATDAFAVTEVTCATGNYSFGHEIGHLQGARHDRFVDPTETPFQYGHGYVDPNSEWRTIMAYVDACGTCPRVQYWSNPSVTYPPTGQVMGTATYEHNARVLNETAGQFQGYRYALSISGPTSVRSRVGCTWTANVAGLTSPYTYLWRVSAFPFDIQSTYPYMYYTNDGRGFFVHLWVNNAYHTQTQWVSISPSAPPC